MATIIPFKGVRYSYNGRVPLEKIEPIFPYDFGSGEYWGKKIKSKNLTALMTKRDLIDRNYGISKKIYDACLKHGILMIDSEPSFYVEIQNIPLNGGVDRVGLVGLLDIEEYNNGIIKPHERTKPDVVKDRLELLKQANVNLEMGLYLYGTSGNYLNHSLSEHIKDKEPSMSYKDEIGVHHDFYRITDEDLIKKIQDFFDSQKIIIADGNHRTRVNSLFHTMRKSPTSRYFLACLADMSDKGVIIGGIERATNIEAEKLLEIANRNFEIEIVKSKEEMDKLINGGSNEYIFGGLINEKYCIFSPLNNIADPPSDRLVDGLSVSVLHNYILNPAGVNENNITFPIGDDEVDEAIKEGFKNIFFPRRVTKDEFGKIINNEEIFSKKTTGFKGKVPSGLVFYDHNLPLN